MIEVSVAKKIPPTYLKHPSLTDPLASIFSPGFRKKRHRVGKFSTSTPSVRSLFCRFQTYTNDVCWVSKTRTWEATNWSGKITNFFRYRGGYINCVKRKNPLGLLQRGVLSDHRWSTRNIIIVLGKYHISL